MRSLRPCLFAATLLTLLPATALANGNVSHQWITDQATELTPPGGSLDDLVNDDTVRQQLLTGTMFPDWGYTPGATASERNAGEASHWEYVHEAYRLWIMDNYQPPWSDEARRHLAFYMGMTSHGMGDQTYDAMFFERSRFYEQKNHDSFDQQSDVLWAATAGQGEVPVVWLPDTPLLAIFDTVANETIEGQAMSDRVNAIGTAIEAVNLISSIPGNVDAAAAEYPWAAANDDVAGVPGNPPSEAEAVRRYWRSNWALLHGEPLPRPVLWTFPADGGAEHEVQSSSIESWVSVVFARGIDEMVLDPAKFHLEDSTGLEVPLDIDLFYGNSSHVMHLKPMQDLVDDEVYVVTIDPGLRTIHGESLDGWSFTFSTGLQGPMPMHDDMIWDEADDYGEMPPDDGTGTGTDTGDGAGNEGGGDGGCSVARNPRSRGANHLVFALVPLLLGGFAVRRRRGRGQRHAA